MGKKYYMPVDIDSQIEGPVFETKEQAQEYLMEEFMSLNHDCCVDELDYDEDGEYIDEKLEESDFSALDMIFNSLDDMEDDE